MTAVARALELVKVYGAGDTAVRALDGVTVERVQRQQSVPGSDGDQVLHVAARCHQ